MSKSPKYDAFAIGKAFAEVLSERLEDTFTVTLGELNKFNAEQREQLRQFTAEVMDRAQKQSQAGTTEETTANANGTAGSEVVDLQATIDELRASIASLRTELKAYQASNGAPS
ncbi:MAG: DUF6825 family protein [Cyanobacteria bacterium J06641_5]